MRTGSDQIATGGDHWADLAKTELSRRGHRAGGARTAVIDVLAEGGCVEAEQIEQRLEERGNSVGTASVYRALGLLTEVGLLRRVAVAGSPVRYELVHPDGHHHHHIVCDRCGRTVAFTDDAIERAILEISRKASFEISDHEITLHGTCDACS